MEHLRGTGMTADTAVTRVGSPQADWSSTGAVDTVPVDWGRRSRWGCWTLVKETRTRDAAEEWKETGAEMQDDVKEPVQLMGRNADRGVSRGERYERPAGPARESQPRTGQKKVRQIRFFSSSRRVMCKASIASWSMAPGLETGLSRNEGADAGGHEGRGEWRRNNNLCKRRVPRGYDVSAGWKRSE